MKSSSALLIFAFLFSPSVNAMTMLQPHRAVYDVTFADAKAESRLQGATGKWIVEVEGGHCTGYTVGYRFVTQLSYEGGRKDLLDTRGESFESAEGAAFQFSNLTYLNNRIVEDLKGIAQRREENIAINLTKPEDEKLNLPGRALFPSQHYRTIIENAKNGERFAENLVYEGIEGAKQAFAVSTLIASELKPQETSGQVYEVLEESKLRRWPITMSYFKVDQKTETLPEWENRFILYENGISRDFIFDYGDFSLKATLATLDYLDSEEC